MFKVGDKVRHWLDTTKGWDLYGIGEVRGYDANLNVYIVQFRTTYAYDMTQFVADDLEKV